MSLDSPGISKSEFLELLLSVGTHASSDRRPLSPEEVANRIQKMQDSGLSRGEIAELLKLRGTSMLGRFLALHKIPESQRYQVGWGENSNGAVMFSAVPYLVRLPESLQAELVTAIAKHRIGRLEIQSITQLIERSGDGLIECVERVLRRRPRVIELDLILGTIKPPALDLVRGMTQVERDAAFRTVIMELAPRLKDLSFKARLGAANYTVSGQTGIVAQLDSKLPEISEKLAQYLSASDVGGGVKP